MSTYGISTSAHSQVSGNNLRVLVTGAKSFGEGTETVADNLASSSAVWNPGDWSVFSIGADRMADDNRGLEDRSLAKRPRGRKNDRLREKVGYDRHFRRGFTAKM